ncbi:unnamed protein product [Trypanosoma congolense IL3000]|uniref:WGS project CAEQ00000000 data, annotated contig 423 n=1 Tax=Trypanosoma congolense (strain IL3000) TaxID=1068625 RepID=F9WFT4_TRYCI|nr:unnamed protein product [Trypanosoma congolense IL3000]
MLKLGVGIGMMVWVMVMVVVAEGTTGGTGTGSNGVCQLNENAAGLLCAIAKLVEKAKNITERHEEKDVKDALGDVALHKEQLGRHKELLEENLEEARQKGTLTAQQAQQLSPTAAEAQNKNKEVHDQAHEVMKNHTAHHDRTKNATKMALGETLIQANCGTTASFMTVLKCHI